MKLSGVYDQFNDWFFTDVDDVWITSDTHFGDKELRAGEPDRPSDDEIVRRINAKCGRKGALIVLGDVGDLSYVRQLRAETRILILGNHDGSPAQYKREIHYEMFTDDHYTRESAREEMARRYPDFYITVTEATGFPGCYFVKADNRLFDFIFQGPLTLGEKLILSHEPIPIITWAMNIHGHCHTSRPTDPYHYNAILEANNFEPFHLSAALKNGLLSDIKSLHRETIDMATERKAKRKGVKK